MEVVGAVLLSSFVAAAIAVWGIWTQRGIARRRTTYDHIAATEADGDVIHARQKFIELAKANGGLGKWAAADKEASEEVQYIKIVLNEFELISIGMQRGIIDEIFYKRWHKQGVISHWKHARPFVDALRARTGNDLLYNEFEELAARFEKDGKSPRRWWIGRIF